MTLPSKMQAGRPDPLGAHFDGGGVNFAIFSEHASRMILCLFDATGQHEIANFDLPECTEHVWHGYLPGLTPGQPYGHRAHGPYRPDEGHRFNPHKLLLDPYARRITGHPIWHDALMGYEVGAPRADLSYDKRDSAPYMPRAIVVAPSYDWADDAPPGTPLTDTVIYEAHVKGLTSRHPRVHAPGKYRALASDPMLEHYARLGITAIELLPIHAFLNDRFLVEKGLTNYWGYQTLSYFAPDPRYMETGDISEFQRMVARLHSAGIEVILDVVYNHTCEGNEMGPTLSFRGLDNASYYRLADDRRHYVNDTGTGNTLNTGHPMVLRMVMDSLRYWVEVMHVDGFRFDLAATLGRMPHGFDARAPFFQAIRQDPVLNRVKLIAEPWDIGPGGYQLGAFPAPFSEWNDKFRDGVRRFWRGDPGRVPDLAGRITGSAQQFDHSGRPATASVNFVTAHDGFTLADTVSYLSKHNLANGEDGRDGHNANYSDNFGVEGPTDDLAILSARAQRRRNMMATLMLSQGVPMILAGDEMGHTQQGNNNAYCQDNATAWIDWQTVDDEFVDFTARMIAFRKAHPILRQKLFLHSRERAIDRIEDLFWRRADGEPMRRADWDDPDLRVIAVEMRTASGTPEYADLEYAIFAVFNAGEAVTVTVPEAPEGQGWSLHLDSSRPDLAPQPVGGALDMPAEAVAVLVLEPAE
ncbi:glycogen debranching protein GlgX [Rhodovulum adriaticum]|uniref:Glycogen operon protein n=1 Tax=Rhodovulum adriaticum TaxID=35804 RepID=A0A4R2NK51_RHOAD|nr:glycogen debranching protein GlgX [Rhodovulum adriaticum]MBK1636769.1 glycogen debranching enzyme GlgX [Rhodovulum adriaticum]TCP21752.1 glycogen operon protein [Rhodovulum adriaticum]